MAIVFRCPCGKQLQVADAHAGRQGRCPACGQTLSIPGPSPLDYSVTPLTEHVQERLAPPTSWEEPPETKPEPPQPPAYKLFSPRQVVLATFLSNTLGGTVVLALNYWALGKARAAWVTLAVGTLITAVIMGVLLSLPERLGNAPTLVTHLAALSFIWGAAQVLQGDRFAQHLRQGGRRASTWGAAGIGVLCAVVLVAGIGGYYLVFDPWGRKINYGPSEEVYYTGGATEAEARQLGRVLMEEGVFDGSSEAAVQLKKEGETFVVSFLVQEGAWDRKDIVDFYRELQPTLSARAFDGKPAEVRLCDTDLVVKKTIR